MVKYYFNLISLCFLLSQISCQNSTAREQKTSVNPKKPISNSLFLERDTTIFIDGRKVTIQYPTVNPIGTILCLPGWNFSNTDVCDKSTFCNEAKKNGFVLVFPDMGKSIYASKLYPETRKDWTRYPQLKFITDTLIPELQKTYSLLKPQSNNFLYGISTGARGVAMIALHTGTLFKAGAALSGDYEQTRMFTDNLMIGYYGPFSKYKDRWEDDDPYFKSSEIKIPLYLAHGGSDKVVPTEQTKIFYEQLKKVNKTLGHQLHIDDGAGHNYEFWGKETETVLSFFKERIK